MASGNGWARAAARRDYRPAECASTRRWAPASTFFGRYNDSPSHNEFGRAGRQPSRSSRPKLDPRAKRPRHSQPDFRLPRERVAGHGGFGLESRRSLRASATHTELHQHSGELRTPGAVFHRWNRPARFRPGRACAGSASFSSCRASRTAATSTRSELGVDFRSLTAVRRDPTGTLAVIADDLSAISDRRKLWISQTTGQNGSVDVRETSLWLQDTWQPAARLTVAAGLRWEFSPPPLSSSETLVLRSLDQQRLSRPAAALESAKPPISRPVSESHGK